MKWYTWTAVLVLTIVLITAVGLLGNRPIPESSVWSGTPAFQNDQAMRFLTELVTRFPERNYQHPDRLAAAGWIADQFRSFGLTVQTQDFSEVIAGKTYPDMRNIYAVIEGEHPEAILVVAHYDIPPFVIQGAADDGSGIAALLELARIFAKEGKPKWTLIFLASDSEEYGAMWGSFNFLKNAGWQDRLAAVVSLDFANLGESDGIEVKAMGIQQGYSPLWLRELTLGAIAQETKANDVSPTMEWIDRSVIVAPTEHGVYLRSGIPGIDLWGTPKDKAWHSQQYHTRADTIEKMRPETIAAYGRSAERLVRSLEQRDSFPKDMFYLKTSAKTYLPGWAVRLIQFLALIPLGAATVLAWMRTRHDGSAVWMETKHLLALVGAGLAAYLMAWGCSELGWMVKYELYPATQKDPVLNHPQVLPILLTIAAFVGVYFLLRWLFRIRFDGLTGTKQGMNLSLILAVCVAAIIFNAGFLALAWLAPALVFWPLVRPSDSVARRILNFILAISVVSVFVVFLILFRQIYFIGHASWYLLMCTAYGLFRPRAILGFIVAAAGVIRFIISTVRTDSALVKLQKANQLIGRII